jgi:hypothetical protein
MVDDTEGPEDDQDWVFPRPKDELDFATLGPLLDDEARAWLVASLTSLEPDHPWATELAPGTGGQ